MLLYTDIATGHYKAEQYDAAISGFTSNPDIGITITVDEVFDNDHRVINQRGSSTGRFTFSSADSGDHKICFTPLHAPSGGWLSSGQPVGGIKLTLDLAIGETSNIESTDKGKMSEIAAKVKDLNGRLNDIRREQVFQRVRLLTGSMGQRDGGVLTINATGTRSRIPRSIRNDQRQGGSMDARSACGVGYYLCMAIVAFESFLYQAEAYLKVCML